MSLSPIPNLPFPIDTNDWTLFQTRYDALAATPLTTDSVPGWLERWSELNRVVEEVGAIVHIESTLDTTDKAKEQAFLNFVENMEPNYRRAEQILKERLIAYAKSDEALGEGLRMPLRKMRNQADLFREANVPLLTELAKLGNEYDKITGGLKADWDGEEKNLSQLETLLLDQHRATRERTWRTIMGLWQSKRAELNDVFRRMLEQRHQIAANAGLPDFRAYTFRAYDRFDYTPDDCRRFHDAIEAVVVPAAERVYGRKRAKLGLDRLRPWDVEVDADGALLKPYQGQEALIQGCLNMFQHVGPPLARHFATMAEEGLLDLDTRSGKALGGYCSSLVWRQRPFIFMNGDGVHDDVQTMLHEAGHAFHAFESFSLPYIWQMDVPMEFCEVASMGMELLAAPYLTHAHGGFYTPAEAARARSQHLIGSVLIFLPYMAVVDGFQHWVYTHPAAAADAAACDAVWGDLWDRFMRGVDWTGFEAEKVSGWHRKLHIFHAPFYYVEYGMAQIGALQVWRNALRNQDQAVTTYHDALKLGGTRPLPELFAAAGAEFRFDEAMLTDLVGLVESTLQQLEQVS